ncbi:MAG TPA: hypothetical protein VH988_24445 [Thermoanaerobaculia bacterium]|nr:hypothetical protein [Thermoanaerobaculia bacterium]
MELRNTAVAANAAELPFLEPKRTRLNEVVGELGSLTAEQANLAAKKQDVSKRIADLAREGNALVNVLDVTLKQHYGNRAEKLAEFGLQPFRSRPRIVLVGPDGKRLKPTKADKETPAQPATS